MRRARASAWPPNTQIAREFFADKGVHVDLIKLYGSMELAPLTGLADAIVDLVSTGSTLKANHLVEVERIMGSPRAWWSTRPRSSSSASRIRPIIDAFERAVGAPSKGRRFAPARHPPPTSRAADFEAAFRSVHWSGADRCRHRERVADILADVERAATRRCSNTPQRFRRPGGRELDGRAGDDAGRAAGRASTQITPAQRSACEARRRACATTTSASSRPAARSWSYRDADGTLLGQKVTPLDRVGIYVPGGKAAYPSAC